MGLLCVFDILDIGENKRRTTTKVQEGRKANSEAEIE
jgi:hypothetical protein